MTKIVFKPPDKNTPGYLRRARKAVALGAALKSDAVVPEDVDSLVEFLLPWVVEPTDREEAAEILWDASENQFEEMLSAIVGDKKSEDSSNGSVPS